MILYERTFSIDNDSQPFSDGRYGFSIDVDKSVASTNRGSVCKVAVVVDDSLCIPSEYTLVSAIYSVQFNCELTKPVTLQIQHCCDEKVLHHLTFMHAKDGMCCK